jgi:hypothetical protein
MVMVDPEQALQEWLGLVFLGGLVLVVLGVEEVLVRVVDLKRKVNKISVVDLNGGETRMGMGMVDPVGVQLQVQEQVMDLEDPVQVQVQVLLM